ncbi:MAG: sigma-E processing peptidase SpoIIGA [Clostridia bacterium]|nr:sigma-E processing peptidase SpoIIGA [Clostridia bacterium]MBO7250144.1 sigma-E processing peptidase SpoIIGA [Clostridia bacterium]
MGETVYVDILFLINFSMDFLCLFLAGKFFGMKISLLRILLSASLGGVYSVLSLFISVGKILAFTIDVAVCTLMCLVCFKLKSLPLYTLVYVAISMMLGGVMTAIFNLLNRLDLPLTGGSTDGISVWMFGALAAISAGITILGGSLFKKRAVQKNVQVGITYEGRKITLSGMTDSGNLLKDPISGAACIIVDIDSMRSILSAEVRAAAKRGDISLIKNLKVKDARSIRLIPIKTAAGDGMLVGIKVDCVTLDSGRGEVPVDAIIVLSDIKDSADGNRALVPQGMAI